MNKKKISRNDIPSFMMSGAYAPMVINPPPILQSDPIPVKPTSI